MIEAFSIAETKERSIERQVNHINSLFLIEIVAKNNRFMLFSSKGEKNSFALE
jgi:hypothetical protein